jgi:hypothetical protein
MWGMCGEQSLDGLPFIGSRLSNQHELQIRGFQSVTGRASQFMLALTVVGTVYLAFWLVMPDGRN